MLSERSTYAASDCALFIKHFQEAVRLVECINDIAMAFVHIKLWHQLALGLCFD
jgi:hypothetical protein